MSQFKNDAKCSFIYFLIFIGALTSCFGAYGIWHSVNVIHGEEILKNLWQYTRLRDNLATLFVAFPFIILMFSIAQVNLRKEVFSVSNPFRRWIIYGGLAIGAIFIFQAVYQIVENFLGGTLVRETVIDSCVLIIVVGLTGIFFLIDVARHESNLTMVQKGLAVLALIGFISSTYVGLSHNKTRKEVEELTKKQEEAEKISKKQGTASSASAKSKKNK